MSSPLSTGLAGPHFESKVGAHYLLSMLVEAPARGLPGTIIDRVEMQRAPRRFKTAPRNHTNFAIHRLSNTPD